MSRIKSALARVRISISTGLDIETDTVTNAAKKIVLATTYIRILVPVKMGDEIQS